MRRSYQINLHQIPVILLSDPFDEGRYNKPYGGGDWNQYQRGQNERDWYNKTTQGNTSSGSKSSGGGNFGGSGGGGGGEGCGMIILIALALVIAIPSAVAALISSLLMILVVKMAIPSFSTVSFGEAYKASFWTTCTYLVIGNVIAFLQVWLYPNLNGWNEEISTYIVVKYFYFFEGFQFVKPLNLIAFHLLCILLSALMLQNKMKDHFGGFKGYGRSIITTGLIILPAFLATFYLAILLLNKYYLQNMHY